MARRIATVGITAALAIIFGYIEAILPFNFGIPGVKLGLANIVVVVSLYRLSLPETAGISLVRILIIGMLFGNIMSLLYSVAGGLLSLLGMALCKRLKLSVIGVSVVGGVLHNVGQLAAAVFVLQSPAVICYYPVLLLAGLVTGFLIGFACDRILKIIKDVHF